MAIRLIVGLGNPGPQYEKTRHNMGFMAVEAYAKRQGARFSKKRFGLVAEIPHGWILKPQTFMNLSGQAVGPFLAYYRLTVDEILVVSDDLDLPFGHMRIRQKGSSGGHNGLKSLMIALGTEEFARLRLGISRPPAPMSVIDWVLKRFSPEEATQAKQIADKAGEMIDVIRERGLELAMNQYNG